MTIYLKCITILIVLSDKVFGSVMQTFNSNTTLHWLRIVCIVSLYCSV